MNEEYTFNIISASKDAQEGSSGLSKGAKMLISIASNRNEAAKYLRRFHKPPIFILGT